MITLRMSSFRQRQPLFKGSHNGGSGQKTGTNLGEAVGEATAVCCCFPCGLANFVFLAMYKLPTCLCRRALQSYKLHHRQRLARKKGMYPIIISHSCSFSCDDDFGVMFHPEGGDVEEVMKKLKCDGLEEEQDKDVVELENEMWENFYGFWRSCSRRGDDYSSSTKIMFSIVSVSD